MREFKDLLRQVMDEQGLKAVDVSKKTGIGSGAISMYLSGKRSPKRNVIAKFAQGLNVSEASNAGSTRSSRLRLFQKLILFCWGFRTRVRLPSTPLPSAKLRLLKNCILQKHTQRTQKSLRRVEMSTIWRLFSLGSPSSRRQGRLTGHLPPTHQEANNMNVYLLSVYGAPGSSTYHIGMVNPL